MRPTTRAIEAAESAVRDELDALTTAVVELHGAAEALRDDGARLTRLKDETAKVERALRHAREMLEGPKVREPGVTAGESVDDALVGDIREARGG